MFRSRTVSPRDQLAWVDKWALGGRDSSRVSHVVFWFGFVTALISATLPPFRYVYLLTPFLVVIALLADGRGRIPEEMHFYLAFLLGGLLLSPMSGKEGLRDLFLTFAGISIGFLSSVPRVRLWTIALLVFAGTMAYFLMFGNVKDIVNFSFMDSESAFESSSAFYMGAFAVFAIYRRQWLLYLFCLACTVLFLKRIALLGALAVGVAYFLGEKKARWFLNPVVMIPVNVAIIVVTMAYALGYLDYYIMHWTHYSANALGQGRQTFLRVPSREIVDDWYRFLFIGKGGGAVYGLTHVNSTVDDTLKINLHSDLMKLLYEYGFIWFVVVIGVLYSVKSFRAKLLALFLNVLFITDNSLIYYLLIFYIVMCCRVDPLEEPNQLQRSAASG